MASDIVFLVRTENLQGSALKAFRGELRRLVSPGRRLILNLAGVDRIDTRGAALVLEVSRALEARGGSLKLVAVQNKVRALFELLRMHHAVEMHNSQREALAMSVAA